MRVVTLLALSYTAKDRDECLFAEKSASLFSLATNPICWTVHPVLIFNIRLRQRKVQVRHRQIGMSDCRSSLTPHSEYLRCWRNEWSLSRTIRRMAMVARECCRISQSRSQPVAFCSITEADREFAKFAKLSAEFFK
jgi:hypothetical protein